jgi:hypothetical protein
MSELSEEIEIKVSMPADVAYQLAQFCKRSYFDIFYNLTEGHLSSEERHRRAYAMIAGIEAVGASLAEREVAPR